MALYTHNYSAIITGGLGGAACCSLLTANFGLNCGCSIEIIIPPVTGGSGGGPVNTGGFFVPLPKKAFQPTRLVLITVKFSSEKAWRRSYVVDTTRAAAVVRIINLGNNIKDKIAVGVEKIKTISRTVTTIFK